MSLAQLRTPNIAKNRPDKAGQPLSIALISTQRGFRGGEMQLRLLAHGFRDAGQRVLIYARRGGPLAQRMRGEGFEVFETAGRGFSPLAMWRLRRRLRRDRPDVVYFNDSHALTSAGLAACGLGIGLRVAARRVAFPIHSAWKYRNFCDIVLANCHATVGICTAGGIPASQVHVVHDGIPMLPAPVKPRIECRRQLGIADTDLVALTVAALTEEKGHAVFLSALPAVLQQHANLKWLCAGTGPLGPALERQADELGIRGSVQLLGQRTDIADLMAAADVVVVPSLCEGLCNAAIEALYARVPLVVSHTGGLRDVVGCDDPIGPDESGSAVARVAVPGDAQELTAALLQVFNAPHESRRLAERGYERATRMFTVERMIRETLATFQAQLARRA
jgi:glycosyltransferase involved in cell wall biosynthesis